MADWPSTQKGSSAWTSLWTHTMDQVVQLVLMGDLTSPGEVEDI